MVIRDTRRMGTSWVLLVYINIFWFEIEEIDTSALKVTRMFGAEIKAGRDVSFG